MTASGATPGQAGPPRTPVEALQRALAAEHAATWVLGYLGARVSSSEAPELAALLGEAFEQHREARDELTARIADAGVDPVASLVDYDVPEPARTPAQVEQAARVVEERVAQAYAEVVTGTAGAGRRFAVAGLRAAAVRALRFGAVPSDFPGLQ